MASEPVDQAKEHTPAAPGGGGQVPVTYHPKELRQRHPRRTNLAARGEPMVWLTGGCVAASVLMILGLLYFITVNGFTTFWPLPLTEITLKNGHKVLGEPSRYDTYSPTGTDGKKQDVDRILYKTGNYDITGTDFTWVSDLEVAGQPQHPQWALIIERVAWQNAYGMLEGIIVDGQEIRDPAAAWARFKEIHGPIRDRVEEIRDIEHDEMGEVAREQNRIRLRLRAVELEHGAGSPQHLAATEQVKARQADLEAQLAALREKVSKIRTEISNARILLRASNGMLIPNDRDKVTDQGVQPEDALFVWQVVRAYPPNQLDFGDKLGVYFSRWGEYLFDEPREANMEGGVFPAIFGTVMLTFIMILFVVPMGVIAAIYLREYAKQGLLLSIVRISVNNLAGVPSIVFGVFGLGFFCYLIGGSIDKGFFSATLPDPTFGKSAMIWASLTLALLTLPVVIVATEEALAAVPRSMREGSYACGASKWQTIRRIVLPRAMPGIMTGTILAIARGAGEVAPLMLVGAVKLAPELPFSFRPDELFGINRSFMHLGFHIYDLGFQSRNAEAARSMVYTTTFLLITLVVLLNLAAMFIRTRLRRAYAGGQF
jgi:phosphate transport system permease protein